MSEAAAEVWSPYKGQGLDELVTNYGSARLQDEDDWAYRQRAFGLLFFKSGLRTTAFEILLGKSHDDWDANNKRSIAKMVMGCNNPELLEAHLANFISENPDIEK